MSPAIESAVFASDYRASGILLHVTSLPSPHGIGDFGPSAMAWIDSLAVAGQSWWQILPIGPPDKGNSPYTPLSTFACNPLLASPEVMIADGLLTPEQCIVAVPFPDSHVDFDRVVEWKTKLLATAFANYRSNAGGVMATLSGALETFCESHPTWLDDYAMFVALKQKFAGVHYLKWPSEIVRRDPEAMRRMATELHDAIARAKFDQFVVFSQLERLRTHAADRGVKLFGDLPIFVSPDSSEVWAHPDLFMLDEDLRPRFVAGVPPDYFSETGQLWGNPVYEWSALRRSNYAWWVARLRSLMQLHDLVRLDHFRGFSAAWHVPEGSKTAINGEWVDGPGADFFNEVKRALGGLPFVAEDLGTITDDVRALLAQFGFPKMGVLQFAFDDDDTNAFLPGHAIHNMVMYTGTHDNDTTRGWYETLSPAHRVSFWKCAVEDETDVHDEASVAWRLVEMAWNTIAAISIAPMQDILNLGGDARMNMPGVADGNWAWRCTREQMANAPWDQLGDLTADSERG